MAISTSKDFDEPGGESTASSPKGVEKPSEKGRKELQRNTTDHPKGIFVLRIQAKSALRAPLVPLFGRFQKVNSRKFAKGGSTPPVPIPLAEQWLWGPRADALPSRYPPRVDRSS
jgi:hypothetical protein